MHVSGRPGKAQLAGLSPGDELSHLYPEPGRCLEAGLLSREAMDRELSRLASWSRSRKIAAAAGEKTKWQRHHPAGSERHGGEVGDGGCVEGEGGDGGGDGGGGGDGSVAAVSSVGPTTTATATPPPAGDPPCVYEEAHFPWKLEFQRQRQRPRRWEGGAAATALEWRGGVDREGSGNGEARYGGRAALPEVRFVFFSVVQENGIPFRRVVHGRKSERRFIRSSMMHKCPGSLVPSAWCVAAVAGGKCVI